MLDKDLQFASLPLEGVQSMVWSPSWTENGSFTITGGRELMQAVSRGSAEFVWLQGRGEVGLLDNVQYSGGTCTISGAFTESMLGWRILLEETAFSGNAEEAVLAAVRENMRDLPLVTVGSAKGLPGNVESVLERGTPLDEMMRTILRPLGLSYAARFNGEGLTLEIVQGKNRTQEQAENSWAILSDSFENIAGMSWERRRGNAKNAATVYGTYGGKTIAETVDLSDGSMRREAAFWADIKAEGMTESQFREVLRSRAAEYLEEYREEQMIDGAAEGESLVFGKDYDLGDIVDIAFGEIGLVQSARVTGADIVMERGSTRVVPKFGSEQMSVREIIRREMKRI